MNKNRILLLTSIMGTALALTGCPSDPPPAGNPDTGPRDSGAGDTGGSDAGTDGGGDVDTGVTYTNDCAGYCMATAAACSGDNAQYPSMAECMATCTELAWPAGTPGATSGNTIACRIYHATVAVGTPDVHCPHTGATGGGVCVGATPIFRADTTGYTRVDRMGMPAVSTALVPSDRKDAYNDGTPADDIALTVYAGDLLNGLGGLHAALDDDITDLSLTPCSMTDMVTLPGVPVPLPECAAQQVVPGVPVVALLLPDALAINPAAPAGFPNGRRLQDPVIDVTLAVILLDLTVTGQTAFSFVDTTTGGGTVAQNVNDSAFLTEFPYLAAAHPAP